MCTVTSATLMPCRPAIEVLIRPDGYVGAIIASDEIETLERYLEKVGLGIERRSRSSTVSAAPAGFASYLAPSPNRGHAPAVMSTMSTL